MKKFALKQSLESTDFLNLQEFGDGSGLGIPSRFGTVLKAELERYDAERKRDREIQIRGEAA